MPKTSSVRVVSLQMEGADVQDFCSRWYDARNRLCNAVADPTRFGWWIRQCAVEIQRAPAGRRCASGTPPAEDRFGDHRVFFVIGEDDLAEAVIAPARDPMMA